MCPAHRMVSGCWGLCVTTATRGTPSEKPQKPELNCGASGGHGIATATVRRVSFHQTAPPFWSHLVHPKCVLTLGSSLEVLTCEGVSRSFLPCIDCSFRIRASSVPLRQRKLPSSSMPPSLHVAAASGTVMRRITATLTCSSLCTSTSTAWRRAAKAEVSCSFAPFCLLQAFLETGFKQPINQYSLVVKISRVLHSAWSGANHTGISICPLKTHQRPLRIITVTCQFSCCCGDTNSPQHSLALCIWKKKCFSNWLLVLSLLIGLRSWIKTLW